MKYRVGDIISDGYTIHRINTTKEGKISGTNLSGWSGAKYGSGWPEMHENSISAGYKLIYRRLRVKRRPKIPPPHPLNRFRDLQ